MCSIVEDDFGDEGGAHAMKEESPAPGSSAGSLTDGELLCRKCNAVPAVLKLNLKEPQCRACFLHYVRHKFRAALGATKIVRRGSRVLIVFTGSAENVVLLDMVRYGLEQEAFKKLRIVPVVLFVSEDCVGKEGVELAEMVTKKLDVLGQFAFPAYFTVIGARECVDVNEAGLLERFHEDIERFNKVLKDVKSITSKQDFIAQIRRQTYKTMAERLDCPYIFLSEIGVDLAKTLLSNVALGRGRSLALDIAFCDDRDVIHKIIRPLRDLNPNEIENYLSFAENQLSYAALDEPYKGKSSLQNLTGKFVDGLQQTFPSTVSTVFKTGDKMSSESVEPSNDEDLLDLFDKSLKLNSVGQEPTKCKFCHSQLDYRDSTTLFATEFSRMVSTRINAEQSHEAIVESSRQMEQDAKLAVTGDLDNGDLGGLKKELCHSCRNIFLDFSCE